MEKFSHSSPWPRIFIEDFAEHLTFFSYDGAVGIPRVIISKTPTVQVQDFGDHVNVEPFEWESKEQFNKLAIEAIIKAHELSGETFNSLDEGILYISETLECGPIYNVLLSKEGIDSSWILIDKKFKGSANLTSFKEIEKGYVYLLPDKDFFGAISETRVDGKELHAIAIMNTRAIAKVKVGIE